jgi:hypothetical protein
VGFRPGWLNKVGITAISAAQGPQTFVFSATPGLDGKLSVTNAHSLNRIGGIVFFEDARPKDASLGQCPRLGYSKDFPNGHRVFADFGGTIGRARGFVYDWEVLPTKNFVETDAHGLFTYMDQRASYNPAFAGNLAGVNLFFVDKTRRFSNFAEAHLGISRADIPGYPLKPPTPESNLAAQQLREALGKEQIIFTDKDVQFIFSKTDDGQLTISGTPYWIAVFRDAQGNGQVDRTIDAALPFRANPVVYGSAFRIAKYTAFFRYLKHHCGSEWRAFVKDLDSNRDAIDTYSFSDIPDTMLTMQ